MIDEKKLIEEVSAAGGCDAKDDYSKGWDDAIGETLRIINEQPKLDVPDTNVGNKWILCSERLPESDKNVLLAVDVDGNKVVTIGMLVYNVWLMEDEYYSYTSANWEVQAWQPLPEPYKEEGADNE